MRRIGRHRHIAARELVLALRAGLDAAEPVRDREFDRLIVAELEMQERDGARPRPSGGRYSVSAPMKLIAPAIQRPARFAITSRIWSAMLSPISE